jgi:hypothetical protein
MIEIVGHWEIDFIAPINEHYFWVWPLRDFEVKTLWMNPISGIRNSEEKNISLYERHSYKDIFNEINPELERVFVEPRTKHQNLDTIWLHEFEHPKDCVYIFGSNHYNPTLSNRREQDKIISIKTMQDKGVVWANQCMVIVLYDRMIKWH